MSKIHRNSNIYVYCITHTQSIGFQLIKGGMSSANVRKNAIKSKFYKCAFCSMKNKQINGLRFLRINARSASFLVIRNTNRV